MTIVTGYQDTGGWCKKPCFLLPLQNGHAKTQLDPNYLSVLIRNLRLGFAQATSLLLWVNVSSEVQVPYDQAHAIAQRLTKEAACG